MHTSSSRVLTFHKARYWGGSDATKTLNDAGEWQVANPDLDLDSDNLYEYRYIFGKYINGKCGREPLIVIGINPSTGKPGDRDNTLKRVTNIAKKNNYDSLIMLNVYAQRNKDVNCLDKECNNLLHEANKEAFEYVLKEYIPQHSHSKKAPQIWAAWGDIEGKAKGQEYLYECLIDMIDICNRYDAEWWYVGKTQKGHPYHPLAGRGAPKEKFSEKFIKFDMENYCKRLTELAEKSHVSLYG